MLNIICFGDSITEGGDFEKLKRWTSLLQDSLDEKYPEAYRVINKGIGGNTSAQGFDRFCDDVLPSVCAIRMFRSTFKDYPASEKQKDIIRLTSQLLSLLSGSIRGQHWII